jgi:hypothetical protein
LWREKELREKIRLGLKPFATKKFRIDKCLVGDGIPPVAGDGNGEVSAVLGNGS